MVEFFTHIFGQGKSFIDLGTCVHIVVLAEVKLYVHVKVTELLNLNLIVPIAELGNPETFYSDINIRQFIIVSVIQISKSDPLVHNSQWYILILLLVVLHLCIIVHPSCLVHHLLVGHPASSNNIEYVEDKKSAVEEEDHAEPNPTKSVE